MARYRRFDTLREPANRARDDLEPVRLRRAGLKAAMSGLELALAAPARGREDEWRRGVREAPDSLHEVWNRHVLETESPGAFLDELVAEAPRLANPVQSLREEHGEILSELLAADEAMRADAVDADGLRVRFHVVRGAERLHLSCGTDGRHRGG